MRLQVCRTGLRSEGGRIEMASVSIEVKVFVPMHLALVMVNSVMPEVVTMKGRRSEADLQTVEDGLVARLFSQDLVAARAAANTLIRLLETSYRTLEVAGCVG
ncbi:MAG: KEOPS complex subunit Pcc1 [Candidatus Caldarchaeum sp.]